MISQGQSSFNFKSQVASDINIEHNKFLPQANFESQSHLDEISEWTKSKMIKLNSEKSKFLVINFTEKYQFSTRLNIENEILQQVKETRLLGVIVNDQLTWHSNTDHIQWDH